MMIDDECAAPGPRAAAGRGGRARKDTLFFALFLFQAQRLELFVHIFAYYLPTPDV